MNARREYKKVKNAALRVRVAVTRLKTGGHDTGKLKSIAGELLTEARRLESELGPPVSLQGKVTPETKILRG